MIASGGHVIHRLEPKLVDARIRVQVSRRPICVTWASADDADAASRERRRRPDARGMRLKLLDCASLRV